MYDGGVREHSEDVHGVSSPEIVDSVVFDDEQKILQETAVGEHPVGGLANDKHTTNRYFTL